IIENDLIQSIVPAADLPSGIEVKDLAGANVIPGFIDLQLNGCGGVMLNDEITAETMQIMHKANLKSGCTSFLPTLITSSDEDMRAAISAARDYHGQYQNQALGLHLEGPYLNVMKKGIHSVDYIRPSDTSMVDFICENADVVAKVTLAPEL
ncbi:amidohydrolase family protein, partial [Vibrio vulnificus]|uniref:amidohydrolase family protein n=1 Tax=Vibrio vulnificus TaxID=672 RepID=UPI0005083E03